MYKKLFFCDKILTFSYHNAIINIQRNIEVIHISYSLSAEDYKKAEDFIKKIRPLLSTGDIVVKKTEKNNYFDRYFSLTHQEKCDVLKTLTADDCYQIEPNNNPRYENANVYKFFKEVELPVFGEIESAKLYLKMYIAELKTYDRVIVISFHKEGMHDI